MATPITQTPNGLNVPNDPIIPYIEGDGIGVDITPVMKAVVDAAVERSYEGARRIDARAGRLRGIASRHDGHSPLH